MNNWNRNVVYLYKTMILQRITYWLIAPVLYSLSLLPFAVLHLISDLFSFLLNHVLGYRKQMIDKYLKQIFTDLPMDERIAIRNKFYRNLGDVIVETIKSITLSPNAIQKRYKMVNVEVLTQYEKKGQTAFIVCGHYSNWEWMASLGLQFESAVPYLIYSPLRNPYFDRFIQRIRRKYNVFLLARQKTIVTLHEEEKKGKAGVYGFAMDQSPRLKTKSYWRPFLGIRVPVFTGAERLAKEYNIPLVFSSINRIKRGYYEVVFEVLEENPADKPDYLITDRFYEKLEAQIYRDPSQYLWSHRRFKHAGKEI